jgi:nicotinamide mononucleotide adenylyltransferase
LLLATNFAVQKGYDVLGGYISPVHIGYGKAGLAPNQQRLEMAQAAVENSDWIMVDDWETRQPSYTRTLPVLHSMRHRLHAALGVQQVLAQSAE